MSFAIGGSCVGGMNYGTPATAQRTDVATGDLIIIAVTATRTGGANTITVTGGAGDSVTAGTANVQGNVTLQFFYILSAVATGTVTYSAASTSAESIWINAWRATSDGAEFDAELATEHGLSGYQGITTADITTAGGIVFFAVHAVNANSITAENTTINNAAPDGQYLNGVNHLTLGYSIQAGFTEDLYFYLPTYADWLASIVSFSEAAAGGPALPVFLNLQRQFRH